MRIVKHPTYFFTRAKLCTGETLFTLFTTLIVFRVCVMVVVITLKGASRYVGRTEFSSQDVSFSVTRNIIMKISRKILEQVVVTKHDLDRSIDRPISRSSDVDQV